MSDCQLQESSKAELIDEIQFGSLAGLNSKPAAISSNPVSRSATPNQFDHKQRRDDRSPAWRSYASFTLGKMPSDRERIPKKSPSPAVLVAPYNPTTHARDREEFSVQRSAKPLTNSNNVAGEYSNLLGGHTSTPKRPKISDTLTSLREQKQILFSRTSPASVRSPLASASSNRSNQAHWKHTGRFALKSSSVITPLGSLRKSISECDGKTPMSSSTMKLAQTLPSYSQPLWSSKAAIRLRGETVENPVELSDDDDDEVEGREIDEVWTSGLSTDISIGKIWFGKCRLLSHGPSRLLLDLSAISSKKKLTIEFTPYLIEVISLHYIMETRAYLRLSGGCTFLSILVSDRHQWQDWALRYRFRAKSSDPVWITMFFGLSPLRSLLETMCKELPYFEEVVSPFDHLNVIDKDLIGQYPCRTLRLDMNSKLNRKKVRKQIVCRYPPQSRDCITIKNGDLESLDPLEFLNDTVIDFKLTHLRNSDVVPKINYHIFSSFFYKRFVTSGMSYDSVRRWTDKQDLFTKDFWLIPICEALHWTLAVVCYPNVNSTDDRKSMMLYYDSLGGSGRKTFDVIRKYIGAALRQPKRLRSADSMLKIEKEFELIDVRVPRQTNSYDCGIYLLLFAEYFLKDPPNDVCSPHQPEWFDHSVAHGHRNNIRDDILEIAYGQSPGNPGPVSTQYDNVPKCVGDDDCSAVAVDDVVVVAVDDDSDNALYGDSVIDIDNVLAISVDGVLGAPVEDFSDAATNSDFVTLV